MTKAPDIWAKGREACILKSFKLAKGHLEASLSGGSDLKYQGDTHAQIVSYGGSQVQKTD